MGSKPELDKGIESAIELPSALLLRQDKSGHCPVANTQIASRPFVVACAKTQSERYPRRRRTIPYVNPANVPSKKRPLVRCSDPNNKEEAMSENRVNRFKAIDSKSTVINRRNRNPRNANSSAIGTIAT